MEPTLLWVTTVGFTMCLVAVAITCVCGCRKAEPKNELLGLAGNVKITNPDDTLSRNGQWVPGGPVADSETGPPPADVGDTNTNKRCSTSANRSLPDLPVEPGRLRTSEEAVLWEAQEGGGDTGSELYATVEDNARPGSNQTHAKKVTASSSLLSESKDEVSFSRDSASTRNSTTVNASDDDGSSTYARLKKEHPYDKLYKSEHPYAQVRSPGSRENEALNQATSSGDSDEPVPPPRSRKSLSHGSLTPPLGVKSGTGPVSLTGGLSAGLLAGVQGDPLVSPTATLSRSPRDSVVDIEAATAIAGRVSASQDLPYMTPPLPSTASQPGQHFSGDSQDSSKGYTSISVREPLANIRQQRPKLSDQQDSHYTTVSDDSDEMYAAIEDPSQVYTSGSETYAQIQPLVLAVPALATVLPSEAPETEEQVARPLSPQAGSSAPQPPSVDSLKHVAQAHSRQASSSSATSSVANLGSPKPDKRAANSPLPPPPPSNLPSPEGACSLEEMYAKVIKKKRGGSNEEPDRRSQDTDSNSSHPSSPQRRFSTPQPAPAPAPAAAPAPALLDGQDTATCVQRLSVLSDSGYETVSVGAHVGGERSGDDIVNERGDPGYETVKRNPASSASDPNYEELRVRENNPSRARNDGDCDFDGYQQIRARTRSHEREPPYARLTRDQNLGNQTDLPNEPDYASISREKKCAKVGAAGKKCPVRTESEMDDPGYERVAGAAADPGYEQVKSRKVHRDNDDCDQDNAGYELVRARHEIAEDESSSDPGYERVRVATAKTSVQNSSDPNYESLQNQEPNYESVRYFNPNKPNDKRASNHISNDGHDSTNVL